MWTFTLEVRRHNLLLWEILSPRDLQQNLERRFLPNYIKFYEKYII